MVKLRWIAAGASLAAAALAAAIIPGYARRGEQLFQTELCVQRHVEPRA
jgi:hypothetical protein